MPRTPRTRAVFDTWVRGQRRQLEPLFLFGRKPGSDPATLPAQPARLRDLRGRNARSFYVRALPRRDGVVLTVYPTGRGPKLRQRERDLRHHRRPPPTSSQAPLRAGRCGRSRRRTERFSFGQRHDAPLARALLNQVSRARSDHRASAWSRALEVSLSQSTSSLRSLHSSTLARDSDRREIDRHTL